MNHGGVEALAERLGELDPRLQPLVSLEFGDAVIVIEPEEVHSTMSDLLGAGFDRLGMVTAVDRDETFEVVYRLHSRRLSSALFVKVHLGRDEPRVDSLVDLWPAALWQEREVYDLFGIVFDGHPDLRRILLPDDFSGYPLRKDYDNPRVLKRPDYI